MGKRPSAPVQRVKFWFSQVGDATAAAERAVQQLLSPGEAKRLHGIGSRNKRREYLLSRSLMRHALAATFARPETEWQLQEQPGSAPRPQPMPDAAWVSLSHSGGLVCFAIASCAVGVDIEIIDTKRDFVSSAEFFMDAREQAQLAAAGDSQADFFYRAWCAKEAWYKALTSEQQAQTVMRSINYGELSEGCDGRRLIEGCGDGFRLAAVVAEGRLQLEQTHYLVPIKVALEGDPNSMPGLAAS